MSFPSGVTADELAIRSLVARYADAVNRRDEDAWRSTWTEDGEWHVLGKSTAGREDVVALWCELMGSFGFVLQLIHSGTIELDGDRATGRWYLSEIWKRPDDSAGLSVGVYHDHYERGGAGWLFARRRFDFLYMGPSDLSAAPIPFPTDL
jgi:hypothetical protein